MVKSSRFFGKVRPCGERKSVRGTAVALVFFGCVAIAAAEASLAAPVNGLSTAFAAARGDRSTVGTTTEPDGRTKVVVRGKYLDGRRFLKAFFSVLTANDQASSAFDIDLDVKVTTLSGFNGEAIHDVALRLSRTGGELREFSLAGKFGSADLRAALQTPSDGRRTVHLETDDAGAFFRFINAYEHIRKGRAVIAIDLPAANVPVRQGVVDVHDFDVAGEPDYKLLATGVPNTKRRGGNVLKVSHLRLEFNLSADQVVVSDGIATGPLFGATVEGKVDFSLDDVALRGIIIPLFTENPILPFSPMELSTTSLLNYRVTGPTKAKVMRIDPFGPLAPGILRRLFTLAPDGK
jgi:hypothetical protein